MKKCLTVTYLLMISVFLSAQNLTVNVPVVTANPGETILIPVKLSGAGTTGTPISSANIQISFDTAVLRYDTLTNFYAAMPPNQWIYAGNSGLVSANWLEPSLLTLTIPDNTTLYNIQFTKKQGSTPLTFIVYEFTDAQYNLINTTPVNGAVNAPAVFRQVTFQVDMSKENISPNGVYLAGSFNNWSTTQNMMTFISGSLYETTISLQEGQNYQYRFVNGNTSSGLENVPPSCGVLNASNVYERTLTIPAADTILPPVCFSMCTACPANVLVTFSVDVQHLAVSPDGIHIAGHFNNWNYGQTPMIQSGPYVYEYSHIMEEGSYQEFLFVNGNTFQQAENPPANCSANGRRYLTIPGHDTTLTTYCYDSCSACGTIPLFTRVTFRVDMSKAGSLSGQGIHIAGSFQGWNPSSTLMQQGNDSIFSHTVELLKGSSTEFRFINGNDPSGYETIPFSCAMNGNRYLSVPDQDTILPAYCFSSCDTCVVIISTGEIPGIQGYNLSGISPNPCRESATVDFRVETPVRVKLTLISMTGQHEAILYEGLHSPGMHQVIIPVSGYRPGLYFCRMEVNPSITSIPLKKIILLK